MATLKKITKNDNLYLCQIFRTFPYFFNNIHLDHQIKQLSKVIYNSFPATLLWILSRNKNEFETLSCGYFCYYINLLFVFQLIPIEEKELTRPICEPARETLETAIEYNVSFTSFHVR